MMIEAYETVQHKPHPQHTANPFLLLAGLASFPYATSPTQCPGSCEY